MLSTTRTSRRILDKHCHLKSISYSPLPTLSPIKLSTTCPSGKSRSLSFSELRTVCKPRYFSTWDWAVMSAPRWANGHHGHRGGCDQFSSSKRLNSNVYATESIIYPSSWEAYADIGIEEIELAPSMDRLCVTWKSTSSSSSTSFPLIWLRDNCRCPQCFDTTSFNRIISIKNMDAKLKSVYLADKCKSINIIWDDGHVSNYPARWLRCNAFDDLEPDPLVDIQPNLWDASRCRDRMRRFNFNELLSDDHTLYKMLLDVKVLGIALVENAPQKLGQVKKLAQKVGFLFPINYGESFEVQLKDDASTAAYLSCDLPLHTDTAYNSIRPGIQMLHCLQQSDQGGENIIVDGFKVANDLRETSPDSYDILTKQVLEFYDRGTDSLGEFFNISRNHVIRLNEKNEVAQITFTEHGRSAIARMHADDVINTYKALMAFIDLLYAQENVFEYKMENGDILIMDNYRVLHGRKGFTNRPGSIRHLEGGYLDWDTVSSKIRILKKKLDAMEQYSSLSN
ncbi:gamma-butyrobetaine dioxygenase-like [Lytechinus pictus]|uniref:gamma-butyrobetaine dioxygenase-like n=2 Tax=Lytechinus pictus TaxID=7653 RepID=UPI0030B9E718